MNEEQLAHEHLVAEIVAMREIVVAVAGYHDGASPYDRECPFCGGDFRNMLDVSKYFPHEPTCPVTRARALLGK